MKINRLSKLTVIAIVACSCILLAIVYSISSTGAGGTSSDRIREILSPDIYSPQSNQIFRDFLWHRCDLIRIGVPRANVGPLDRLDSAWWTCKELYEDMKQDKSCLVYGLGSGGDVSFDQQLANLGCEVHSFDIIVTPENLFKNANTMFTPVSEVPDFRSWKHNEWNWHYHLIGLGERDNPQGNILSLPTIMNALNHQNRIIHYFKIDIEGPEYPLMKDIEAIADRIKTFAGEWHPPSFTSSVQHRNVYNYLRKMESKGFRLIRRDFRYDFISPKALAKAYDTDPIQSDLFYPMSIMGELYFINKNFWNPKTNGERLSSGS